MQGNYCKQHIMKSCAYVGHEKPLHSTSGRCTAVISGGLLLLLPHAHLGTVGVCTAAVWIGLHPLARPRAPVGDVHLHMCMSKSRRTHIV